jgi:hypothetical protein
MNSSYAQIALSLLRIALVFWLWRKAEARGYKKGLEAGSKEASHPFTMTAAQQQRYDSHTDWLDGKEKQRRKRW